VTSSDARSVSSDSTFTGGGGGKTTAERRRRQRRAYTMKDRDWHRELVEQYSSGNPREPAGGSRGDSRDHRDLGPPRDARTDLVQLQSRAGGTSQPAGGPSISSRYQAGRKQPRDPTRRSTTVVILQTPPPPRSNENSVPVPPGGGRRYASPQPLHKPASVSNLHQPPPFVLVKEFPRPRDSSCPRYAEVGKEAPPVLRSARHGAGSSDKQAAIARESPPGRDFGGPRYAAAESEPPPSRQGAARAAAAAGNFGGETISTPQRKVEPPAPAAGRFSRPGSSSEKKVASPRMAYGGRMAASASPDVRSDRRPSVTTVTVDPPTPAVNTRSASYQPREATRRTTTGPPEFVSDIPPVNWSVTKLVERYSGGGTSGGGASVTNSNKTSAASALTSSVTTVKVDKSTPLDSKPLQQLPRIAAVKRLL